MQITLANLFRCVALALTLFLPAASSVTQAQVGGVRIDAAGLLHQNPIQIGNSSTTPEPTPLDALPTRCVSLNRLQQVLESTSQPWTDQQHQLAGLVRVDGVAFDPSSHDIILFGPGDEITLNDNMPLGRHSGRPPVSLDDLVNCLRYAFADGEVDGFIGCTIEPTPEGLNRLNARMSRLRNSISSRGLNELTTALGPQRIQVFGVPADSLTGLKMVAADYRMKRIALGIDPSPFKTLPSYMDLEAARAHVRTPPQHRWWFVAHFDAIQYDSEQLIYQLKGPALAVQTARTTAKDDSRPDPGASPAAREFATRFSQQIPELSSRFPVFAELQNIVGLSVVTELINQRVYELEQPGYLPVWWTESAQTAKLTQAPISTPPLMSVRNVRSRRWLISISGGVKMRTYELAAQNNWQTAPASGRPSRVVAAKPADRSNWWWDVNE